MSRKLRIPSKKSISLRVQAAKKDFAQRVNPYKGDTTPLIVIGSGRSGTTMMTRILDKSPQIKLYQEAHNNPAFDNFRLRSFEHVMKLAERSPAKVVALKPKNDTQYSDKILELDERIKAIWIFRYYVNVASSAVKKWELHHKDVIEHLLGGNRAATGWHGEGVSEETIENIRSVYNDSCNPLDASCLVWYIRNRFLYELALDKHERVLIVNYEDLVGDPVPSFKRVFRFADIAFQPQFVSEVFSGSGVKKDDGMINPKVREMLDEFFEKLQQTYKASLDKYPI